MNKSVSQGRASIGDQTKSDLKISDSQNPTPEGNTSDLQIDSNPFARRQKSRRQDGEQPGKERRNRILSGGTNEDLGAVRVDTEQSGQNNLETPNLPDVSEYEDKRHRKPLFNVEDTENNITNISLVVSQMNTNGDVIEEMMDESDTFRPKSNQVQET